MVDSFSGQVQADSGRFELKQLPVSSADMLRPGNLLRCKPMRINQFNLLTLFAGIHLLHPGHLKKPGDWLLMIIRMNWKINGSQN